MHTLGKLLVIWGMLFPLMILSTAADRIDRTVAIPDVPVCCDTVLVCGLFVVELGLSFRALPR